MKPTHTGRLSRDYFHTSRCPSRAAHDSDAGADLVTARGAVPRS